MLMNNLDQEVAERPDELVVYGGTGRAARSWAAFDAIVRELERLENDETLLVQSGKPVGVLRTHFVGWLMLAPSEAEVRRKVARYYPEGVPPQFGRFVHAGTPAQFVEFYQARVEAGIQYFVPQMLDGTDHETLHLLAEEVMPEVG